MVHPSTSVEHAITKKLGVAPCRRIFLLSITSSHAFPVPFPVPLFLIADPVAFPCGDNGLACPDLWSFDIGIYPGQQLVSMPIERRAIVSFSRQCLSSLRSSRSTAPSVISQV